MNEYKAFYNKKEITVKANNSYGASIEACKIFKAKKSHMVGVVLLSKGDTPVTHSTQHV